MKILITDDAIFMRGILKKIIKDTPHEVIGEASNGLECIEKYKELQPDLVIVDITMPEMDGLQALKELKKIDKSVKVIMCSAMGQQMMVMEAIQSGALDFIVKPFQPDRIIDAIHRVSLK